MLFNLNFLHYSYIFRSAGENFKKAVEVVLRNCLTKGVPPLFVTLKALYSKPEKVTVIEEVVLGYAKELQESGYYTAEGKDWNDIFYWKWE